jgi:hypothetical protein
LISNSYGEEESKWKYGASFSGGYTIMGRHSFTRWGVFPRADVPLHPYWDLEVEGNFSYYKSLKITNLYVVGVNTNLLFKPIRWDKGSLFLLGGAGVGYNNNTISDHHKWDVGNTHINGTLQGGVGINYSIGKGWGVRGEYRFNHISDPFKGDPGINTHNFMLGFFF